MYGGCGSNVGGMQTSVVERYGLMHQRKRVSDGND
jgi:hypothetical protein